MFLVLALVALPVIGTSVDAMPSLAERQARGRKLGEFAGQEVRVLGVCNKTAKGGTFNRLHSVELAEGS